MFLRVIRLQQSASQQFHVFIDFGNQEEERAREMCSIDGHLVSVFALCGKARRRRRRLLFAVSCLFSDSQEKKALLSLHIYSFLRKTLSKPKKQHSLFLLLMLDDCS